MTIPFQAKILILVVWFTIVNVSESIAQNKELPKPYVGMLITNLLPSTINSIKENHNINLSNYGVFVTHVNSGGPADSAGFKNGDILLELNGMVIPDAMQAASLIATYVEKSVVFKVLRNGYLMYLPVKIVDKNLEANGKLSDWYIRAKKKDQEEQQKKQAELKRKNQIAKKEKQKVLKELESKKITLAMGSGFWFNNQGYFATNHHVIEGCKTTQIKLNNELVNSKIISFDKINDLAIGKVDKNIESVFLLSDKPELGEDVMVGGFPLSGVLQNDSIKITRGIVSSLSGFNNNYSMLQIDAPIQKGNSGGPIINSKGEVIGIATAALKSTKEYEAQNVNFGVKVNLLRNMAQSLGIDLTNKQKLKTKNSKQLAKALEKNTVHIHCTNTLKQWVAYQNNQNTNAKLSEYIKLNLKDYMK